MELYILSRAGTCCYRGRVYRQEIRKQPAEVFPVSASCRGAALEHGLFSLSAPRSEMLEAVSDVTRRILELLAMVEANSGGSLCSVH